MRVSKLPPRGFFTRALRSFSELCGQKLFACGQQNPLAAKNARARLRSTDIRYSKRHQRGFLRDLCEPWRVSAVKSFLPVDAKQFSRQEKPTRPTDNLPAPRGARPRNSRAAWRRSDL